MSLTHLEHGQRTQHQQDAGYDEHRGLHSADGPEDESADCGGYYLRQAYRAVEKSEIAAHVLSAEGVREYGERQGEHCGPGETDQEIGQEEDILVADEERFLM